MEFRGGINNTATHDEQFVRRASHGKCFYQPFFGCREFPAFFEFVENVDQRKTAFPLDMDLGWMLYDVFDLRRANDEFAPPRISVFHARMILGVLNVPEYGDPAVKKVEEVAHA